VSYHLSDNEFIYRKFHHRFMETKLITLTDISGQEVIDKFSRAFQPGVHLDCSIPGHLVHVFTFEEYFLRIESDLGCTIVFNQKGAESLEITIIVAGGSHGLFGITWGAETSTLNRVKEFIERFQK
jgi:hypothetical protein